MIEPLKNFDSFCGFYDPAGTFASICNIRTFV